jgi:GH18 family chitinase
MLYELTHELSPVAEDRGGIPADFDNYVNLLRRLRARLDSTGREYGISLTLVSSLCSIFEWFATNLGSPLLTGTYAASTSRK